MTADTDTSATDDKPTEDKAETADDKKPERPGDVMAMEAALKKANKEAADARKKLKDLEDKDKSETDRAKSAEAEAVTRAEKAEAKALRLEVATAKGLSPAQAKRLVGTTQEELEADADEILESFAPATTTTTAPPSRRPNADLKGGTDPTEEATETDPAKLAASVPRL